MPLQEQISNLEEISKVLSSVASPQSMEGMYATLTDYATALDKVASEIDALAMTVASQAVSQSADAAHAAYELGIDASVRALRSLVAYLPSNLENCPEDTVEVPDEFYEAAETVMELSSPAETNEILPVKKSLLEKIQARASKLTVSEICEIIGAAANVAMFLVELIKG